MGVEWRELTELTAGRRFRVQRVRLADTGIAIEGEFELPALARMTAKDQVFVAAFVRCHGSIKQMERMFGVSYPTIKNRLNRIAEQLEFVEIDPRPSRSEVLEALAQGDMSVAETIEKLQGGRS